MRKEIFFVLASVVSVLHAQEKIKFDHLNVRDGLSQSAVTCIFQDRQGLIWLGTQDGLNLYDGYTFKVYKHDESNPKTLAENFITSIHEDSAGTLWFGTLGFFHRFDRRTEQFVRASRDSLRLTQSRSVSVLAEFRAGEVQWSGAPGRGLVRLNTKTRQMREYKHDPQNKNSLSDNNVYSVYVDRGGIVWIGTSNGLNRLDPKTERFTRYIHNPTDPTSLSDNWVWPIFEDRHGTLWVGTVHGGLNRFNRSRQSFVHFRHDETDPSSLSDDYVFSIYEDASGMLWVGTNNGLNKHYPSAKKFQHFSRDHTDPNSLADNNVSAMMVDRSGACWIGTRNGLDRYDPKSGRFTHFTHDPARKGSLADNNIQSLYEDLAGDLWVGTFNSGLDCYDPSAESFRHFRREAANPNSLADNSVYAVLEDRDGILWIGTYRGGLTRYDPAAGTFKRYKHIDSLRTSLSSNGVWSLFEDAAGNLWVGTYGGGLNLFEKTTGTFVRFQHDSTNQNVISDNTVLVIKEDRNHMLWIGTLAGLNRFDPRTATFTSYREKDGLPNDVVLGILEDESGNLWLGTNNGLSRFDPGAGQFRNYDFNDGLQSNEFNQNAFAKNPTTGEMYFGGINGFNRFHPDNVRDNPFVPPIVFSSFYRYNTDDEEGKPIEEKGIFARDRIDLTYKDNVATVSFSALNFYKTSKNQYLYKLEGFNDQWIQLGTNHQTTFTNLDAGTYTLRVRGSNNDGVWNTAGASLQLNVTPPWWKTRFAYTGYGFLTIAFLYGLRRVEINRREQKTAVRESELRAKAAEAEKRVLEVENERKSKELEEARQLQLSMLPKEVPKLPHLEIAVFMRTSTEVGGDYYDFRLEPDGTLNVACGDATGHGMQAGTVVTLMKGLFTSDASRLDLRAFFNHCSTSLKEIRLGRMLMAFTLIKIRNTNISFATAGMPPVFIYKKSTDEIEEVMLKGMPLGAMKNFPYVVCEKEVEAGDLLLVLTDGLPEQKNASGEMFDYARVQDCLKNTSSSSPQEIISNLVRAGDEWMNGIPLDDDITMIAIQFKG